VYGTRLCYEARDRPCALDVLRSCHAILDIFEESTRHLAHQYISRTSDVLAAVAPMSMSGLLELELSSLHPLADHSALQSATVGQYTTN
jgi:hypothetical protein